jgi:Xeroderma pigmentosum group B helicase damage recognition domain
VNSPHPELAFDRGTLLLRGVSQFDGWNFDPRVGCLRTHAIHYAQARADLLRIFGPAFHDKVRVPPRVAFPHAQMVDLRDEQKQALANW